MSAAPPQLSERRVEEMRRHVMHAVDEDISRRGRRARRIGTGLAVTALVIVVGGIGVGLANSGSQYSASNDSAGNDSASYSDPSASHGSADGSAGGSAEAPEAARDGALAESDASADPDAGRDVITTGSVQVTVDKPRDVAQQFSTWVESVGGRVDNRSEDGGDRVAFAQLTVRVPSDKVTAAVDELRELGSVDNVSIQKTDVTLTTTDLDARIDALNISVARLEKILSESSSSEEIIKAETALTERQEQLESLQSQRAQLSDQVALSSLDVQLVAKERAESPSPGGFRGGIVDGWNSLVSAFNGTVQMLGAVLPWAGVVLVLSALWFGIRRLVRARRGWN